MAGKNIIFIHGMFMTPLCWEEWVPYFKKKGFTAIAPAWPERDRPIATLREAYPDPTLGKLTLTDVLISLTLQIRLMKEKPILIGHSMGGLIVQLLLRDGLGEAGVAIDSAPPAGVLSLKWSFLKSNFSMINPFVSKYRPREMPFRDFQYAFVNTLPLLEQQKAYDRYAVPESRRIPQESLTATAKIDFSKVHSPLLMIAGEKDHIIPASLIKTNYQKYQFSPSKTDFKEFPDRVHFLIWQRGWQEIADYILEWLKGV
jgi:pimeloyl-ACP methyl ester carboxylesterase